jgi:predicted GTPase
LNHTHLSNRPLLQKDIEKYIDQADVMLTELKAAAVDVATKDALQQDWKWSTVTTSPGNQG